MKADMKQKFTSSDIGLYLLALMNIMHGLIFTTDQAATFFLVLVFLFGIRNPWVWGGLFLQSFLTVYVNFEAIDNHKFLTCYANLAVFCALFETNPKIQDKILAEGSRILIGLCMLLAVFWKFYSPEFLTSVSMQYFLLTDDRFFDLTRLLTGMDIETLVKNQEVINEYLVKFSKTEVTSDSTVVIQGSVGTIANFFTAFTIIIELVLAALFLVPKDSNLMHSARIGVLVGFFIPIYFIVPVVAFGKLLIALSLLQLPQGSSLKSKPVMVLVFVYCILPAAYFNPLSYF